MGIQVDEVQQDNVLVFRLKGRLDAVALSILEEQLYQRIDGGNTRIVLNFSGIEYLSSAGLRLLLSVTKKLKGLAGKMALCLVSQEVLQIIKLAGFDHILTIQETEESAMNSAKG